LNNRTGIALQKQNLNFYESMFLPFRLMQSFFLLYLFVKFGAMFLYAATKGVIPSIRFIEQGIVQETN